MADTIPVRLTLVSASPRRQDLLRRAGYVFDIFPSSAHEDWHAEDVSTLVKDNARKKVERSIHYGNPDRLLIGADTIVVMDGQVFGKPAGPEAAARMLEKLSGNTHRVLTGICLSALKRNGKGTDTICDVSETTVTFRMLSKSDIRNYIRLGEWNGKAGGYAAQGLGGSFIKDIKGDFDNVVGLPIGLLNELLARYFSHCTILQ